MSAVITGVVVAAVGTSYGIYSGERASQDRKRAQRKALRDANKAESQAQQAFNAENQKKPDLSTLLANNREQAASGSTMLTGPGGAAPMQNMLGRRSLLGG